MLVICDLRLANWWQFGLNLISSLNICTMGWYVCISIDFTHIPHIYRPMNLGSHTHKPITGPPGPYYKHISRAIRPVICMGLVAHILGSYGPLFHFILKKRELKIQPKKQEKQAKKLDFGPKRQQKVGI